MSQSKRQISLELARQLLKQKGYTYRQAGPALGVHFVHLCLVLTGKRISASLLRRISELPPREIPDAAPIAPSGETPTP